MNVLCEFREQRDTNTFYVLEIKYYNTGIKCCARFMYISGPWGLRGQRL